MGLLRRRADLLAEEAGRNPEFGSRLERLLSGVLEPRQPGPRKASPRQRELLPDVHSEWSARGESDFRLRLRDQPIPTIRAVIRAQDLDPTRRTVKWQDPEKLAGFVADSLRGRLSRGSAFIGSPSNKRSVE